MIPTPRCRACGSLLERPFVNLGLSPPCEHFLTAEEARAPELLHPLEVLVCDHCLLAQSPHEIKAEEIFHDYAYFSSFSESWLEHARRYCEMARTRFGLDRDSFVVELASNDGYLLKNFVEVSVPCLGVEPSFTVAEAARKAGVETLERFFGVETALLIAKERGLADLIVANNVLAHVPDILDFVRGIARLLKERGRATFEFPHLLRLIEGCQYDTIYHEHYSYLSLHAVARIFRLGGLEVFDVEELPSHGGSLRVYAQVVGGPNPRSAAVEPVLEMERAAGLGEAGGKGYRGFQQRVDASKRSVLTGLIALRESLPTGAKVVGYGAPGKGNTLLNYCGIRTDLIDFLVDRNPYKHGRYAPGTRIPIHKVEVLQEVQPTAIVIMPWNLAKEIVAQLRRDCPWQPRLFIPIPTWQEVSLT